MSKESIIRTVTSLESHTDLRLTTSRQLPGFLITTTLNLPPGEPNQTLAAHYVNPSVPPPAILASPAKLPRRTPYQQRTSSSSSRGVRKREYDKYGPNERKS